MEPEKGSFYLNWRKQIHPNKIFRLRKDGFRQNVSILGGNAEFGKTSGLFQLMTIIKQRAAIFLRHLLKTAFA